MNIDSYLNDGANYNAQAILAIIRGLYLEVTGETYDPETHVYNAQIHVGRYENGREQGYVFTLMYKWGQIKHYAVYEHRNSDNICILCQSGFAGTNTPNADFMFGPDRGKYDVDKTFSSDEAYQAAKWILQDMKNEIIKKTSQTETL